MHIQEKRAWFIFIVMMTAFVVFGIVVLIVGFHPATFSVFAIGGLGGFVGLIGARQKKEGLFIMDERDHEISRRSIQSGFSFFWILFIFSMLAPMLILGPDAEITMQASNIAALVFPPSILVCIVQSLTTIILYRKGDHV